MPVPPSDLIIFDELPDEARGVAENLFLQCEQSEDFTDALIQVAFNRMAQHFLDSGVTDPEACARIAAGWCEDAVMEIAYARDA